MSAKPQGAPAESAGGYEKRDANVAWIFGIVAFLIVAGLGMHFALAGVLKSLEHSPAPADAWRPAASATTNLSGVRPAFPRLQVSPPEDLKDFRAREEAELNSYGWVNRTAGVVRVPINEAMRALLKKGLPVRSETNASTPGPSSYELQWRRPEHREQEIQGAK